MARNANIQVDIDISALTAELSAGKNGAVVARQINMAIKGDVDKKHQELVNKFRAHPVSQEIAAGPRASNTSGTLGGYGNLFSFLGFDNGAEPLEQIESILSQKIKYRVRSAGRGKFIIAFSVPKAEEIFAQTPMPWASSLSWAGSIEGGVSNLASYLFNPSGFPNSSSGTGLQSKNRVSGVSFRKTPYVTSLLKEFTKDLTKL